MRIFIPLSRFDTRTVLITSQQKQTMLALILTTLLSFASAERALVLARKTITSEFNQEFNGESLGNMLVEGRNVSQS